MDKKQQRYTKKIQIKENKTEGAWACRGVWQANKDWAQSEAQRIVVVTRGGVRLRRVCE